MSAPTCLHGLPRTRVRWNKSYVLIGYLSLSYLLRIAHSDPREKIFFLETGLHIPKLLRNLFSEVSEYVFLYFCSFYKIEITNTPRGKR